MRLSDWLGRSRKIALIACLLPASSCAAAKCGDYKHFEFEPIPGMSITETRVPSLNGLSDVKPFPVSYVLRRSGYEITLRADEKAYGPTVTLSIDSTAAPMTLKTISSPPAADAGSCISKTEQDGSVRFFWLDWKQCAASQSVRVAVIDATGGQVAIEELPFNVVTNGRYCVKDAL